MEQDKQLKQILLNSAAAAAPGFTTAVMKRINDLSAKPSCYQPLVSAKWQRVFLLAFSTVVGAIFFLCLIIAVSHIPFISWLQSISFPDFNYNKLLMFIITFWAVFIANALLQKKLLLGKIFFRMYE